jgi:serine/threonine protein kinase
LKVCPRCFTRFPDAERFCLHDSAVLVEEQDIARLNTAIGNYRLEKILGRGGMGTVYSGEHIYIKKPVAVKVLHPQFARYPEAVNRFLREARAASSINHPNIVDVTDFGYADAGGRRLAYLVMEYLDGCSLADVLRDQKALPIPWIVDVLTQVGSALEEAHRAGILHRDLKPDNIWLEPNRRGGYTVKVLDFGLAKLGQADEPASAPTAAAAAASPPVGDETEEATMVRSSASPTPTTEPDNATAMGSIIGTPAYMSPEQCRGLPLSPRSDVYSLAVIAYRLLSGALPFSGNTAELIAAHVEKQPTPIGKLRKGLPKNATELVMRALSKAPEDRPASAGAFTEMLGSRAQTGPEFFKQALLLFLEHGHAFVSASMLGLAPVVLLGLFAVVNAILFVYGIVLVPPRWGPSTVVAAMMLTVGPGMLLVQGSVVPAVMQAVVAPLQPIDVKTLRRRFRPRFLSYVRAIAPFLWLFVITGLWQFASRGWARALRPLVRDKEPLVAIPSALLAALLPILPLFALMALLGMRSGSWKAMRYLASVAVVEGLSSRRALARSAQLANAAGSERGARVLMFAMSVAAGVIAGLSFGLLARLLPGAVVLGMLALFFALAWVLLAPLFAVINALTYLRARRSLGEPLDKALADFERAVLPESHWKLAERERVATLIASRW